MYMNQEHIRSMMNDGDSSKRLSIYIPTTRQSNADTLHQDKTRLKNAFAEARQQSKDNEDFFKEADKEIASLMDDMAFWKHQDRALAVFISENTPMRTIPLPYAVTEFSDISSRYRIAPLLLQSSIERDFYVLDCNLSNPRLMHSTGNTLELVELENMPTSFEEEFAHVEYRQELQHRGAPRGSGGAGAFHAHDTDDSLNNDIETYLGNIAAAADAYLKDKTTPLILVGTVKRVGFLRGKINYPQMIEASLDGDYSTSNPQEIYELTSPLAEKHHEDQRHKQVETVTKADPRLIAKGAENITKAINDNRAETIFIPCFRITTDGTAPGYKARISMQDNIFTDEVEQLCRDIVNHGGKIIATDQADDSISEPMVLCRYPADA